MALTIEEQIKAIEEEISSTDYNKATQLHIGKLKAKLARLKGELEKRRSTAVPGKGYSVKKSGNATVALVGFPSVGKSTLLNKLTGANSLVAEYQFTTVDVVPGIMYEESAKIQVLDLPGLIKDASKGKGRGREVLSVVRSADLILLMLDMFETNVQVLIRELEIAGIRLNQGPPDVVVTKTEKGGILVKATVQLTKIDEEMAKAIVSEYGHINAEVVIREDVSEDQLIDVLAGNRVYTKAIAVVNKIDLAQKDRLSSMKRSLRGLSPVFISAEKDVGLEDLRKAIFDKLDLIRVYMKRQGAEADMKEPMVIRNGSTVGDVCDQIHRTFRRHFRYALVWGKSAKFPGQMVGLEHRLVDGDVLSVIVSRGRAI
ncbi:MAG: GTP-binding protein [Methanomassiliicoccales archaeon]|nr:GTP-binding protein [Methanomassiliicoccales archaeon]